MLESALSRELASETIADGTAVHSALVYVLSELSRYPRQTCRWSAHSVDSSWKERYQLVGHTQHDHLASAAVVRNSDHGDRGVPKKVLKAEAIPESFEGVKAVLDPADPIDDHPDPIEVSPFQLGRQTGLAIYSQRIYANLPLVA